MFRKTAVMRWQCGHHVAKISSMYGFPASVSEEITPPFVVTENAGATLPTLTGGGKEGIASGLIEAPLTWALRCTIAYVAIAMTARIARIAAARPPREFLGVFA